MVAVLTDSLFRIPLTNAFVKNFFRLFSNFFASVPRRSPPGEQLVYFTTLPSPCQRLFPYFQLFSTLCNPCQNLGLYLPCHRTLFLPLTFMIHYSYIGRMLDRVRHGVDSPKAFCFCPIPSTPQKFLSPAFSAGVCAIGGHDIHFVLTGSSSSCGSTMPCHDISRISLYLTRCFVCISSSISIRSLSCFTSPITIM